MNNLTMRTMHFFLKFTFLNSETLIELIKISIFIFEYIFFIMHFDYSNFFVGVDINYT